MLRVSEVRRKRENGKREAKVGLEMKMQQLDGIMVRKCVLLSTCLSTRKSKNKGTKNA